MFLFRLQRVGACFGIAFCILLLQCVILTFPVRADDLAIQQERIQQEDQRQQQRGRDLRHKQEQTLDVRLPANASPKDDSQLPDDESPCFAISHILLTGELADYFQFSLKSIYHGVDPAIGRCLGSRGINIVLTRVQNAIIAQGYVTTRVLLTPQDLKSGTLNLTVIPGRIHAIRFSADSSHRGRTWNALPINKGDLLNLRDIEQGLENLKRVPTAEVDIQIEPASGENSKIGESDLIIRYQQARPFRLAVSTDDSGSKATGRMQGNITLSLDNPLTLNDLFYASFGHDLGGGQSGEYGTNNYTIHYSLPFGYWSLGLTSSGYNYHQTVVGTDQNYSYSGESRSSEIKLSRLIYRDASRKTTASFLGYFKNAHNFIDDTEIDVQRRKMAGWEAALAHREFIGSSTLDLKFAYRHGTGAMHALAAPEEVFNEGTARPQVISSHVSLNVPFTVVNQAFRYNISWRGQWNKTPLIPQDRFSIAGRYTVRGYDGENSLSAERGWLVRNDLDMPFGNSGQALYIGFDYGHVSGQSADLLLGNHLSGAVIGLHGAYKQLQYDLFAGAPLAKPDGFEAGRTVGFNVVYQF